MTAAPHTAETFYARVEADPNGGCWLWGGYQTIHGYGSVSIKNRRHAAHRVSYEFSVGPIPENMCVMHKCDVRCCVNPDHLTVGSWSDNTIDMQRKGRNRWKKLSPKEVTQVRSRKANGERTLALAKEFGVHQTTIDRAVQGTHWMFVQ